MRPWTLHNQDENENNPLLANMGLIDNSSDGENRSIRSYATAWGQYINGNVVSELSRRCIIDLMMCTTAPLMETPGDSSDSGENDEDIDLSTLEVGGMSLVRRTLQGMRDNDEGAIGFGRYSSSIRLGRDLWQSPPLTAKAKLNIRERVFDNATFPDRQQIKNAFRRLKQEETARPLPFAGGTPGLVRMHVDLYECLIYRWFRNIQNEENPPTPEQLKVLGYVRDRVLIEYRIEHEGMDLPKGSTRREFEEEPLRGLIHGPPGSGKSELIKFVRRFFEEALGWSHGVEFIFVAYQNKVAHAMKGSTIHNAGMLDVGQQARQLNHTDVEIPFTKNANLKWIIIDEIGMVSDHLLGSFATAMDDASNRPKRFRVRHNGEDRIFGGYNLLMFGDFQQLAPCPPGGPLFVPPDASDAPGAKQERARSAKSMFWTNDANAINMFFEMKEQKRIDDPWYA